MRESTRRASVKGAAAALTMLSLPAPAIGQAWPSKPIRFLVTFPPGGIMDTFSRHYAEALSPKLGQQIIVDFKSGASGAIGAVEAKQSPPDGYTLMWTISTTMIMNKVTMKSLPYDPDKDFVPVAYMGAGALPMLVARAVPATNIKEFVAFARSNKVSMGTYGVGSYGHIAVEELNREFGLSMEAVHYRGETAMWTDLAAGTIHAASGSYLSASRVLQAGNGRAIAVPTNTRMRKLPDVATFMEQGIKSKAFQILGWIGMFAPVGVPQPIIDRLSDLMVEAGKTEKIRTMLETFGIDRAAEDQHFFRKIIADEGPIWIELVKSLGLTPQ